ncbi:hypothetical protein PanWU01x14_322150 [Parasponia andersonii]|uniref:Uncharacterized protein n=1 Tax=Parasponia andersonii TaxID=3476 RepID=A0A2P5AL12_PARAD|nr:hypothetical protein PanWU01x14_322150 [Parasponia andersonii]
MASLPFFVVPIIDTVVIIVVFVKLNPSESSPATGMAHHAEQDWGPEREGSIGSPKIGVRIGGITTVRRLITTSHFLDESALAKGAFYLNLHDGIDYLGTHVTPIP